MTYGIEIRSESNTIQLTSEASSLLFVDMIQHVGDAGATYAYPELTGRQVVLFAVPFQGFAFFSITYPGGVPTVKTLEPEWGTGLSQVWAYVFAV